MSQRGRPIKVDKKNTRVICRLNQNEDDMLYNIKARTGWSNTTIMRLGLKMVFEEVVLGRRKN